MIESYIKEVIVLVRVNVCPKCKTESEVELWVCTFNEEDEAEKTLCPACKEWIKLN